jgi:putative membrane protein
MIGAWISTWLDGFYPWIKAVHVIFVIFWMAGLFMLPRFFIYHQESDCGSSEANLWVERERRLIQIILNPAMIITWVFGLSLALTIDAFDQIWFLVKLLLVVALSIYHGWMLRYARSLREGESGLSGKSLRLLNEIPGLVAITVVILAIVKPF